MIRLAIVVSHPIQYLSPLYRAIAAEPNIDLTVYYQSRHGSESSFVPEFNTTLKWDVPLLDGYKSQFLHAIGNDNLGGFFRPMNPSIVKELYHGCYDAVWIHGYSRATIWLAVCAAKILGIPIMLRGESHLLRPRSFIRKILKWLILKPFFALTSCFLYVGKLNYDYWRHYGVEKKKLYFTPYCIDDSFFIKAAKKSAGKASMIRDKLRLDQDLPIILSVAKIYDVKQPIKLLNAYELVRKDYECGLVYVGDGPLRYDLENQIKERNIPDVRITGFINQSKIPEYYAAGDILALISWREAWGLPVNEAMYFGLPVLASDRVASAHDLVTSDTGIIVPHDSDAAITEGLRQLVSDSGLRAQMGEAAMSKIKKWGIAQCVDGVQEALRSATHSRKKVAAN